MKRRHVLALIAAGLAATAAAVVVAVVGVDQLSPWFGPAPEAGSDPDALAWLVALVALFVAVWLLWDRTSGQGEGPDPAPDPGPIREETPEATTADHRLTGGELVDALVEAGEVARADRDVRAGVAVVRPLLRDAYHDVRGHDATAGDPEAELDAGEWTDDPVAAAVLSADVSPPSQSLRQRFRDWLYPGRAVTRRVTRAVDGLAAAADESVPPVVGRSAPRQVPVHEPSLAARTVDAGGDHPGRPGGDGDGRDEEPAADDGGEHEVSRS